MIFGNGIFRYLKSSALVLAGVALCLIPSQDIAARSVDFGDLQVLEPASRNKAPEIDLLYLSLFESSEQAAKRWEKLKQAVPELHYFTSFVGAADSKVHRVPLLASPAQRSLPLYARQLMMRDTCQKIKAEKLSCKIVAVSKTSLPQADRRQARQELQTKANSASLQRVPKQAQALSSRLFGFNTQLQNQNIADQSFETQPALWVATQDFSIKNDQFDDQDILSREAAKAAYDVIQSRYVGAIQRAGESYNITGDWDVARSELTNLGVDAITSAAEEAFYAFFRDYYGDYIEGASSYDGLKGEFINAFTKSAFGAVQSVGKTVVSDLTASGNFKSVNLRSRVMDGLGEEFVQDIMENGLAVANNSQYAFLKHLELEFTIEDNNKPSYSALTILPIHRSDDEKHTMFTQVGYNYRPDDVSRSTLTGGLAYRFKPLNEDYLLGTNFFLDYEMPYDHLRASLGADFQTKYYGASGNFYRGISGWRKARTGFEEKALGGYDVELSGRMPVLPALEVFGRAYKWNGLDGENDIKGREGRVEYTPVPAFTVSGFVNSESGRSEDEYGLSLRYNHKFGAPAAYMFDWDEQFRVKDVDELVYKKVRRENIIRTQERIDASAAASVPGAAVLASTPANAATNLSIGTNISITFDQDVVAGAGNIVVTDLTDASDTFTIPVGDPRVTIVNDTVTVDLSAQLLDYNSNYDVTFDAGVFESLSGNDANALNTGDLAFTTIVDPIAGFPAATLTMLPNTTGTVFSPANIVATWQARINIGASPDGVIFEGGGTGRGIGAAFGGGNLVFAAGDGGVTTTTADTIFGTFPIASIPQGLHDFVFVAEPTASAEIGVYMDGIRIIDESIVGAMDATQWSGGDTGGYGLLSNSFRAGLDNSAISGATLISNLDFYSNQAPASF